MPSFFLALSPALRRYLSQRERLGNSINIQDIASNTNGKTTLASPLGEVV